MAAPSFKDRILAAGAPATAADFLRGPHSYIDEAERRISGAEEVVLRGETDGAIHSVLRAYKDLLRARETLRNMPDAVKSDPRWEAAMLRLAHQAEAGASVVDRAWPHPGADPED